MAVINRKFAQFKIQFDIKVERDNMKLLFGLVCVSILSCIVTGEETCETPSITTNSGTRAFTGPICPGDLIFEDEFNDFDLGELLGNFPFTRIYNVAQ